MQKHNLVLYHYWRSSCSWRVRWALNIKNIKYTSVAVNLLEKKHHQEDYRQKSPTKFVPCLEIDGKPFNESIAIIEWLEDEYPIPPLLPKNYLDRLKVRQLVFIIASGTQPIQNLSVQQYYSAEKEKQKTFAQHWITLGLEAYEKSIESIAGAYSFGDTVTLADICLIPQCYNAERFGVDLNRFPKVTDIYQNCLKTKECELAAPHNQPDAK